MLRLALILVLFTGSVASAAEPEPVVLQPSNNWELNYASERCRLTRTFGTGAEAIEVQFERFEPGVQFRLTLIGDPLRRGLKAEAATLQFGASEASQELKFRPAMVGSTTPAWIFPGSTRIAALPEGVGPDSEEAADFSRLITPQRETDARQLDIGRPFRKLQRLNTGSLGPAFAALRKCTDEVLSSWGFDVEQHRNMTRPPKPIGNFYNWIGPRDYPRKLLAANANGVVEFRLDVDETGKVSSCHIQQTTRPLGFDQAVCELLKKRAGFEPALDANGQPMRSYWRNTVWFEIG